MAFQDKVAAAKVDVGVGKLGTAVCRKLTVGAGRVEVAIVYEKVEDEPEDNKLEMFALEMIAQLLLYLVQQMS